jgi:TRAP-type C4-dicarboxylate transport system substrate-binding protein
MKSIRNVILATALAATAHAAVAQVKWDFPTGYPTSSFQTENLQQFADDVAKATGGKLNMTVHANASLYKVNEIKRAVQTGQVQIGEFILSGASNENPIFGVDSIPFLATSYEEAKKLSEVSRPAIEKLLASQGMKLLYVSPGRARACIQSSQSTLRQTCVEPRCALTIPQLIGSHSCSKRSRRLFSWLNSDRHWPQAPLIIF